MSFSARPGDVSTLEQSHSFLVTSCSALKSIGEGWAEFQRPWERQEVSQGSSPY